MIKSVLSIALSKGRSLFNRSAFSARIMMSEVDRTAAVRNRTRFYGSTIGRYSYVGRNSLVQNTKIGAFCSISESCFIGLPSHRMDMVSTSPVFLQGRNILRKNLTDFHNACDPETMIGNDVWVGTGVMIKSGIHIGDGAVIGAGAVVTHDVPPYAIIGGVPARVIRYRYDQTTIEQLLSVRWWDWPDDKIKRNAKLFVDPKNLIEAGEKEEIL